ncbi:MAG: bacillithiol biosynthesis deacetylase BshB1 [Planctomycetes bacterium]|nr:bacillithiol biosynthesis deacetylase BshB1 [Planctomycetota bacterium]
MADLLVFAAHPDDAEIGCGATIAAHVRAGASVVIVDATRGELSSRGTVAEREREAAAAAAVLGVGRRENLGLRDGHLLGDDLAARALIVDSIRRHRPRAVLCMNGHARHPDHIALARLVAPAIKAAALHQLATPSKAAAYADARVWFYEAELPISPTFLVPCSEDDWGLKRDAVRCYASQLHRPGSEGPVTTIASAGFLSAIEARGRAWGTLAGSAFAEAFTGPESPRVTDLRAI